MIEKLAAYSGMFFGSICMVCITGLLDRVRGDSFGFRKAVDQSLYGWFVAMMIGHGADQWTIPFVAAFVLGTSIGWGEPYGAYLDNRPMISTRLEWWQVGILKNKVRLALVVRGLLWCIPILLLGLISGRDEIQLAGAAYLIAFPLAVFIKKDWEISETIRGCIAGTLILGALWIID